MKKFLLNCGIYLGVAISAVSCSKDDDQPQALSNKDEFSVSEARTFFERNADVMRPLDLSWSHRLGSGADLSRSDMVPLWSKAQTYKKAGTRIVEVPLQVYGAYRAYAHFADKNKAGYMADGEVIVHLVIEKETGAASPSCFITSFIPDKEFLRGGRDKADALRLFLEAETGYTGLVIRSEMDGKLRGGLMYEGGKITGRLRSGESVPKDKEQGRMLLGMVNVATKGGEGGDGGTTYHGDEYEGMYWCTKCLMYHDTPQCIWLDDIVKVGEICLGCHHLVEMCSCCPNCFSDPCRCPKDRNTEDPSNQTGGGGVIGGGQPEKPETPQTIAPRATMVLNPNSPLKLEEWKIVENVFVKMNASVIGNAVISYLKGKNINIKVLFLLSTTAQWDKGDHTLSIRILDDSFVTEEAIFHELFHACQYYSGDTKPSINLEVECYSAMGIYIKDKRPDDIHPLYEIAANLVSGLNSDNSVVDPYFYQKYSDFCSELCKKPAYNKPEYELTEDHSFWNFNVLHQLLGY